MRAARTRRFWSLAFLTGLLVLSFRASLLAGEPLAAPPTGELLPVFAKTAPENVDDLLAIEQHVQKLSEKLIPCTVGVQIGGVQGSGVIIKDGFVLTAGHVSGTPGRDVSLTLHDGRTIKGKTLGRNTSIDSGLIKITDQGKWAYAEVGSSKNLKPGQWCLATGHPGGYQKGRAPVVRLGRVVSLRDDAVRTDCTLVGGDSGGPLFDMHGHVIGIHSRISNQLTDNFHVPATTYTDTWTHLAAGTQWPGSAIMGVNGKDVKEGCQVIDLSPGLPAEKAGLKIGDVITKVDQEKIGSLGDLVIVLAKYKSGDEVTVEFLREKERRTQKVQLAARPR